MTILGLLDGGGQGEVAPIDDVIERDRGQEVTHLTTERGPEIMRAAALALNTTLDRIARAAGHAQRLVRRRNDLGHRDQCGIARQPVATARPAGTLDEPRPAQTREQLLEVFLADVLTLGNR